MCPGSRNDFSEWCDPRVEDSLPLSAPCLSAVELRREKSFFSVGALSSLSVLCVPCVTADASSVLGSEKQIHQTALWDLEGPERFWKREVGVGSCLFCRI